MSALLSLHCGLGPCAQGTNNFKLACVFFFKVHNIHLFQAHFQHCTAGIYVYISGTTNHALYLQNNKIKK
jgi:hypothetical protein